MPARLRQLDPRLADAAVALALLVAMELQLLLREDPAPTLLAAVCAAALAVPLAWRRTAPLAALAGFAGVTVAQSALGAGIYDGSPPLMGALAAGALAFHGAGARSDQRTAVLALGLGVAALWTSILVSGLIDLQSFVFSTGIVALSPWLAGRVAHAREARERALVRERDERARAAVSEERQRLARELHDVVAHGVVLMRLQAQGAERVLDSDPDRARAALRAIDTTGAAALGELRRSLGMLGRDSAAERTPQRTLDDLGALVAEMREAGLAVELVVDGEKPPLEGDVDRSAYRVVQEALTNTVRHAGMVPTRVHVRYGPGDVELEVIDEGPGYDGETGGGHGLLGMRERIRLHGGELLAHAGEERGFVVRARIPVGP